MYGLPNRNIYILYNHRAGKYGKDLCDLKKSDRIDIIPDRGISEKISGQCTTVVTQKNNSHGYLEIA